MLHACISSLKCINVLRYRRAGLCSWVPLPAQLESPTAALHRWLVMGSLPQPVLTARPTLGICIRRYNLERVCRYGLSLRRIRSSDLTHFPFLHAHVEGARVGAMIPDTFTRHRRPGRWCPSQLPQRPTTCASVGVHGLSGAAEDLAAAATSRAVAQDNGLLEPLVQGLEYLLQTFQSGLEAAHVPHSFGWSIVALTAVVKLCTFPLTKKQVIICWVVCWGGWVEPGDQVYRSDLRSPAHGNGR